MELPADAPQPFSPRRWREAQAVADHLVALCGAPAELALKLNITRRLFAMMRDWMRLGEAFVRRMVLLEALALPRPNPPPPQPSGKLSTRSSHGRPGMGSDDPADWGVVFRMTPPPLPAFRVAAAAPPKRAPDASWLASHVRPYGWEYRHLDRGAYAGLPVVAPTLGARRAPRPSWAYHPRDPRPLAERLEALLRVVANPTPYAQRLARRLYDRAGAALIARMLKRPRRSPADPDGGLIAPLQGDCEHALCPRDTS